MMDCEARALKEKAVPWIVLGHGNRNRVTNGNMLSVLSYVISNV